MDQQDIFNRLPLTDEQRRLMISSLSFELDGDWEEDQSELTVSGDDKKEDSKEHSNEEGELSESSDTEANALTRASSPIPIPELTRSRCHSMWNDNTRVQTLLSALGR